MQCQKWLLLLSLLYGVESLESYTLEKVTYTPIPAQDKCRQPFKSWGC